MLHSVLVIITISPIFLGIPIFLCQLIFNRSPWSLYRYYFKPTVPDLVLKDLKDNHTDYDINYLGDTFQHKSLRINLDAIYLSVNGQPININIEERMRFYRAIRKWHKKSMQHLKKHQPSLEYLRENLSSLKDELDPKKTPITQKLSKKEVKGIQNLGEF